jgi:hypothetical protein
MQPDEVHGRKLAIIRQTRWGFILLDGGQLSQIGESFQLSGTHGRRLISSDELSRFQPVTPQRRVLHSKGFDFFLPVD